MTTALEAQSPVEIDSQIAELLSRRNLAATRRERHLENAERASQAASDYADYPASQERYIAEARKQNDLAEALAAEVFALNSQIAPLNFEFDRRGGWTRAYLVTNAGGHVHKDTRCTTCYSTTQYFWVTDLSGHDEAEIVEKAGERACTVCYPSAPVEVLSRPTQIFSDDEKAAQVAREERAAKAAARDAAKVTVTVPVEVQVGGGHKRNADGTTTWSPVEYGTVEKVVTYKTLRALQNDAGAVVRNNRGAWAIVNGFRLTTTSDPEAAKRAEAVLLAALAERGVDVEDLVAKQVKRAEKERG